MLVKASAPGSLMLLGEYAVLYGKQALVCAVDKRMQVTLTPRIDDKIFIHSALGQYQTDIKLQRIEKPFHFVLATLQQQQRYMQYGCDLHITADFSDKVGFGSSAAVVVATMAAQMQWLNIDYSPSTLIRLARKVIREMQGMGSGADIAASVLGGMVAYQARPLRFERLTYTHPITALYAGFKTPTPQVIQKVEKKFQAYPQLFQQLCKAIGQCADAGIDEARVGNWEELGKLMASQQGLMEALGVNHPSLAALLQPLQAADTILGAKISGSGLGDCVVGLGTLVHPDAIPVKMGLQGVQCEKI